MSEIITVGLDLAKNVFQAHCAAADGAVPTWAAQHGTSAS